MLSLGTGCLIGNPAYGDATGASEGGASTTSGGPGATTSTSTTTTTTTSESGGSGTGEAATSTGEISASAGTGGSSTGEASTGEASTGGPDTGGPFCAPDVQLSAMCEPLADTGFLVCETLTSWTAAKASCEAVCGRLAVIHDDAVRMTVYLALRERMTPDDVAQEMMIEQGMGDQAGEPRASYWLGASAAGPNLDYGWLDGTVLPAQKGTNGWGPNDPDYSGLCVVLGVWGKGADDGELFDRGCDSDTYRYLCEPG